MYVPIVWYEIFLLTFYGQDMIGSIFSFSQLVISSVFVDHDPSGIIANPAKLGLAGLSFTFDIIFIVQKYWLYRTKMEDEERE